MGGYTSIVSILKFEIQLQKMNGQRNLHEKLGGKNQVVLSQNSPFEPFAALEAEKYKIKMKMLHQIKKHTTNNYL